MYVQGILIASLDTRSAFRDVPLRQASKLRKLELGQRSSPHKHSQTFFYVQIKDTCYTAFIKMNVLYFFYLILLTFYVDVGFGLQLPAAGGLGSTSTCTPFQTTFSPSDVSQSLNTPFVAVSKRTSYEVTGDGLELFLDKPSGAIQTKNGVNSKIAEGSTINSTFVIRYVAIYFLISGL